MKRTMSLIVSGIGLLVLFVAFVLFANPIQVPALGTVKLTDMLAIVGGVLFIGPIWRDSVARKSADGAPHRFVWATLPLIGVVVVCVGILIPNAVSVFGLFPLADLFYLAGCLMILPVFAYPPASFQRDVLEDMVDDQVEETEARHSARH
ncbi:permease [Bifidobacterium pullorum subsp. saeculare]|uniref:Permease n=1 Tax=Bifidobacterium pullorum subsp. saeculare TaxID=78257 RepID=A0A938WVS9_9BIFI|nr:permease [Bifidobacterium pullorum]MBM6698741.1 permease [Bifidobacterium pullorum subsp. saeculare]